MELTEGILKSVESAFVQKYSNTCEYFVVFYKEKPMINGDGDRVRLFKTEGGAKTFVTTFIKEIFWHGEYWQTYASQTKIRTGYDINYKGTIEILSSYGPTSRFNEQDSKKLFKDIADELIKQKIITIKKIF